MWASQPISVCTEGCFKVYIYIEFPFVDQWVIFYTVGFLHVAWCVLSLSVGFGASRKAYLDLEALMTYSLDAAQLVGHRSCWAVSHFVVISEMTLARHSPVPLFDSVSSQDVRVSSDMSSALLRPCPRVADDDTMRWPACFCSRATVSQQHQREKESKGERGRERERERERAEDEPSSGTVMSPYRRFFWNHKRGRGVWEGSVPPFEFQERSNGINPERRLTFPRLFLFRPHNRMFLGPLRLVLSWDLSTWM